MILLSRGVMLALALALAQLVPLAVSVWMARRPAIPEIPSRRRARVAAVYLAFLVGQTAVLAVVGVAALVNNMAAVWRTQPECVGAARAQNLAHCEYVEHHHPGDALAGGELICGAPLLLVIFVMEMWRLRVGVTLARGRLVPVRELLTFAGVSLPIAVSWGVLGVLLRTEVWGFTAVALGAFGVAHSVVLPFVRPREQPSSG